MCCYARAVTVPPTSDRDQRRRCVGVGTADSGGARGAARSALSGGCGQPTTRKPRFPLVLSGVFLVRAATRYRLQ
ncbi:hypothetical protein FB384_003604 [Prauserella sediminis]|uniref:Uncharacterized protein n=1 Tax=Prauserella sediminis TaxID=577680 RepID=A0A839XN69_9PSEU|nr:hypothetical protein [Prauserella sediminis]